MKQKNNIWINGGVIDPDFVGELGVIIVNMNSAPYVLEKNEKFCQLICEKAEIPEIEEIREIPMTERGENGFGSTGK